MARLAIVVGTLFAAACGDNLAPPPFCSVVEPVFAYAVPLHTMVRALPSRGILLAGTFRDPFVLGGRTLVSAGGTDIFIARIDADGSVTASTYGDGEDQELLEVVTNGPGDVAIAGRFRGSIEFGGGALVASGTASSMFVASVEPGGGHRFSVAYPVEAILRAIAMSATGDVAISGSNFDPIDFGGGPLQTGGQFLGVLDASGAHVASRLLALEDKSVNLDVGIAFDRDELVVAGSYTTSIDLGGGPLPSAGELDFYLARFARTGAHRTSTRFGGPGNDGYRGFDGDRVSIAPVADGVVLASSAQSPTDELDDIFVTHLDDAFAPIWNQTFALPSFQAVGALAIAADGTIGITGISSGETDATVPAACGGSDTSNAFATLLDPDGRIRWSACLPASSYSAGLSVAWRGTDELVLAGTFDGTLDIGTRRLESENLSGFVAVVLPACE